MTETQTSPAETPAEPTPEEQRGALIRLLVVVGGLVTIAIVTDTWRTVAVVVAFFAMIMFHEAGHYATAKWGRMKVTEFFVGFGPRLWSVRKGETEYGVKALPVGGYVKIIGMNNLEDVPPEDEARTYRQQPFPQRFAVAVAGSTVHFLLALLLFFLTLTLVGVPFQRPGVGGVVADIDGEPTPAAVAGLQAGDMIISIDGRAFDDWSEVPDYVQPRAGEELLFVVERDGELIDVVVTPMSKRLSELVGARVAEDRVVGFVGIEPPRAFAFERVGVGEAVGQSFTGIGSYTVETVKALGRIFSPSGMSAYFAVLTGGDRQGGESISEDGGDVRFLSPVGFARIASQAARAGVFEVLQLLVLINVFVGVFNMLPLLPLDGGHVAIAIYEAIRSKLTGRRHMVDLARVLPAYYLVLFVIVFIGVTSLYMDIVNPLENPFQQ